MLLRWARPEDYGWIEERAGCVISRLGCVVEAIDRDGAIAGQVAFDGWTPASVQMHVAIERPMAVRALLRPVFQYVFEFQHREVAIGIVRAGNERALKFDKKLGFVEVARLRDGWDIGEDLVLLELRKSACRWLDRQE